MVNPPKELTVEQIYQKKSQLEHILLRPDTYIGSRTCGYGTLSTRK
jgi:DNA topoisomerase-2